MNLFRRIPSLLLVIFFAFLFVGCQGFAKYAPPIEPNNDLDVSQAYVFGKFELTDDSDEKTLTIALNIVDVNNEENQYHVKFTKDIEMNTYGIVILPGTYMIKEVLFIDYMKEILRRVEFDWEDARLLRSFEIKAGEMLYLGDFVGKTEYNRSFYDIQMGFSLFSISNNYNITYQALLSENKKLEVLESSNIFEE
jgi:hypothetical protein